MAHLLGAENIRHEFPTKTVFSGITIGVNEGDRIGVVGRNGDGKSTLLKVLAKRLVTDEGRVTYRSGLRVGMLDQQDSLPEDMTVAEAVVGNRADHEWAGDAKVRDVVTGLVNDLNWQAKISELSGGQRRRVALAALLSRDWDVVLLDEPTNHLDVEGVAWLAAHLKQRWPASGGGMIVVTHDRWFLDEVCNLTWEVHDGIIDPFEGGYAAYILQRTERNRSAAASEARRQNLLRKELAWLRRGAPARTSKPKFRMDAAAELIANEPAPRDAINLQKMAMQRLGKDVVDLENVGYAAGEKTILSNVTWRLGPGDRVGLVGVNGAGKTTLLKLVSGELEALSGRVKRGKTVNIATLTQDVRELDEFGDEKIFSLIAREKSFFVVNGKEVPTKDLVEQLGFSSAQLQTPISDLSGGQRRRLQFLRLLFGEPNVLILDEPTNDLDTDILAAMEDLLDSWPGTLIVVSHDRYLLERVTDTQYALLGDGSLRHLTGGVDQYLELRRHSLKNAERAESVKAGVKAPVAGKAAAAATQLSGADLRNAEKNLSRIERALEKLATDEAKLHLEMTDHDQSDYAGLAALSARQDEFNAKREGLELEWLETSELLG